MLPTIANEHQAIGRYPEPRFQHGESCPQDNLACHFPDPASGNPLPLAESSRRIRLPSCRRLPRHLLFALRRLRSVLKRLRSVLKRHLSCLQLRQKWTYHSSFHILRIFELNQDCLNEIPVPSAMSYPSHATFKIAPPSLSAAKKFSEFMNGPGHFL